MCGGGAEVIAKSLLPELREQSIDVLRQQEARKPAARREDGRETIIYHGNILTMAGGKFSPAEALATRGDTIAAVGTLDEVQAAVGRDKKTLDYTSKFILPGLIDPHVHLLMTALTSTPSYAADFSYPRVRTCHDALELTKKTVEGLEEGEWMCGYGYDPSLVEEHVDLTLDMLDRVAGERHPVFILNQSGHVAYLNGAAFVAANIGIEPGTPGYPANDANFEKGQGGGLTGLIFEEAVITIVPYLRKMSRDEAVAAAKAVLESWASRGITTVFDCGIGHLDGLSDLSILRSATLSPLVPRFRGAIAIQAMTPLLPILNSWDAFDALDALAPPPWKLDDVQVYGIKFWLDGSTQGFTAALNTPYLDSHETGVPNLGILNYRQSHDLGAPPDDDGLARLVQPFVRAGWQIVMHANGSRAVDQALRVFARVFAAEPPRAGGTRHMHRLEHVTADVSPAQLRRAAQLGLGVSHLIAHVRKWGPAFERWVLGPARAARVDPVRDTLEAGVTYSFHSDSPISRADPLQYVETAVTRQMDEGGAALGPEQAISLEAALAGVTFNPARQIGALHEVGTLEWGKKADLVVLDRDPREVGPRIRSGVKVLETWIGGRKAFQLEA